MSDVERFLAGIGDELRRAQIAELHEKLSAALPDQEVGVSGKFLTYGHYHYRYASGREGDSSPVLVANNKREIAVYIAAADDSGYLAELNAHRLGRSPGKVKVGRSCIKFEKLADVEIDVLLELARRSVVMVGEGKYSE